MMEHHRAAGAIDPLERMIEGIGAQSLNRNFLARSGRFGDGSAESAIGSLRWQEQELKVEVARVLQLTQPLTKLQRQQAPTY